MHKKREPLVFSVSYKFQPPIIRGADLIEYFREVGRIQGGFRADSGRIRGRIESGADFRRGGFRADSGRNPGRIKSGRIIRPDPKTIRADFGRIDFGSARINPPGLILDPPGIRAESERNQGRIGGGGDISQPAGRYPF